MNSLLPLAPPDDSALALAGQAANDAAARHVFADYRARRSANTLRRQKADLALFAAFLEQAGVYVGTAALALNAEAWKGISYGLVMGFNHWQLAQGYAVGTVNVHLSTLKTYARLAMQAGALSAADYALIRSVTGYQRREGKRLDEKRSEAGAPVRKGTKKAEAVTLSKALALALKTEHPKTPQGRRDALLMCLLLDHGLRCGEVALLTVGSIDLKAGELRFYRPKVDKHQVHRLTPDTLKAARAYFNKGDAPLATDAPLLRASNKRGELTAGHMSERSITRRVALLGALVGAPGLSAHDCRHYWATAAARNNTALDRLQDAGGWNSPAMPLRYVEAARIANEGIKLD